MSFRLQTEASDMKLVLTRWWGILKGESISPLDCFYPAFVGFICRETDRTMPISASCMESAVPP